MQSERWEISWWFTLQHRKEDKSPKYQTVKVITQFDREFLYKSCRAFGTTIQGGTCCRRQEWCVINNTLTCHILLLRDSGKIILKRARCGCSWMAASQEARPQNPSNSSSFLVSHLHGLPVISVQRENGRLPLFFAEFSSLTACTRSEDTWHAAVSATGQTSQLYFTVSRSWKSVFKMPQGYFSHSGLAPALHTLAKLFLLEGDNKKKRALQGVGGAGADHHIETSPCCCLLDSNLMFIMLLEVREPEVCSVSMY